ncbi:hypothetical protein AALP_AA6G249900 [Arabis alpina]|uniref:Uncharacterized protein n=1 Tax=Arabis alpina TaxID=50452 RepID=A0A087GRJ2_ARAAL|nr:hypothetical protein AALP_AA6G249900 [Arabis alpina]
MSPGKANPLCFGSLLRKPPDPETTFSSRSDAATQELRHPPEPPDPPDESLPAVAFHSSPSHSSPNCSLSLGSPSPRSIGGFPVSAIMSVAGHESFSDKGLNPTSHLNTLWSSRSSTISSPFPYSPPVCNLRDYSPLYRIASHLHYQRVFLSSASHWPRFQGEYFGSNLCSAGSIRDLNPSCSALLWWWSINSPVISTATKRRLLQSAGFNLIFVLLGLTWSKGP